MTNIYQIRNTLNGDIYVGKTVNTLKRRFAGHKCDAKNDSRLHLHRAMRLHGVQNFEISLLDIAEDNGSALEQKFISDLCPKYNMARGGDGGSTIAGRRAITNGLVHFFIGLNDPIQDGFRLGISDSLSAKNSRTARTIVRGPHTEETKLKISKAREKQKIIKEPKPKRTRAKPCTIDNITFFESKKDLEACLGRTKVGSASPHFRYV